MTTKPQQERSPKRLQAEKLFEVGMISPTEVARNIEGADVANVRKWRDAWLREHDQPIPKLKRGGRRKEVRIYRPVRSMDEKTQLAAQVAARGPADSQPGWVGDQNSRPFDVFERIASERFPTTPTFLPRDGASMCEMQDAAFMRASFFQMTDQDAAALAAISRDDLDRRLAETTKLASGMTFADEAKLARAMGQYTSLKTLGNYIHQYPNSSKALDLASWLLERRAPAFIRKSATAVAIASDVHIRTAKDDDPNTLMDSIDAVQARLARTRFGIAALPPGDVIDAEVFEEDDENA